MLIKKKHPEFTLFLEWDNESPLDGENNPKFWMGVSCFGSDQIAARKVMTKEVIMIQNINDIKTAIEFAESINWKSPAYYQSVTPTAWVKINNPVIRARFMRKIGRFKDAKIIAMSI